MNRTFYKVIFFILSFFLINASMAQTLYWIGGSGNLTDPKHWSDRSGGLSVNKVPNSNSDLVFEDAVITDELKIGINGPVTVNSIAIRSYRKITFFANSPTAKILIKNAFTNVLDNTNFNSFVNFEFNATGSSGKGYISAGNAFLNSNFQIVSGNWEINKLKLAKDKTLQIAAAAVDLYYSTIDVGGFNTSFNAKLKLDHALVKVTRDFKLDNSTQFTSNGSYINKSSVDNKTVSSLNALISGPQNGPSFLPCVPNPVVVKPSCVPGCDGTIIVTIPDPTCFLPAVVSGSYNLLVNNNPTCTAISGLNNVTPGTYTLTNVCFCQSDYNLLLFDAVSFGFLESVNASVTEPLITSFITSSLSIRCNAACTGSINLAFIGGTSPYTYTITKPASASTTATSGGGLSVVNICAGTLTVDVKDFKNCARTFTYNFTQPTVINPNAVTNTVTCNGSCNGSYVISPTGGTSGYTVSFNTGPTFTVPAAGSASIGALCPAAYTSTITDANGCTVTVNTNITQPPAITITATQTNVICATNCNGSASVSVTGGTSPYTYTWSPGPNTSTNTISSLCGGTQTVSILDNNLCPVSQTFNITSPPAITVTLGKTDVTCNTFCNGSATAQVSGGTGALTFTWTGPAPFVTSTNSVIINLCPGVYTLNATDAVNCTSQQTISITQPPAATVTSAKTDNTCFSNCAGSATVTIIGGNGAPFGYTWTPGVTAPQGQGTATLINLCANVYTLTATDASLCPISTTVSITQPSSVTPNVTTTSVTCNGGCNGSLNSLPSGGAGAPYSFTLVTPAAATLVANPPFINLCAGIHTLSVSDASSCVTTQTFNVTQPPAATVTANVTNNTCFSTCSGSASVTITGGNGGPYSFTWTPGITVPQGQGTATLNSLCAGSYTMAATDVSLCPLAATLTITQPTSVTPNVTSSSVTCNLGCNGTINSAPAGGNGAPYTFTLVTPANTTITTNPPFNGLCAGIHTLTVRDASLCVTTQTVNIAQPNASTVTANITNNTCFSNCAGSATVSIIGGNGAPFGFTWTPGVTAPQGQGTATLNSLCSGNYTLSATDASLCPISATITITQPSSITPNVTSTSVTCNGSCNGSINSAPVGGNGAPYNFTLVTPAAATVIANPPFNGLCAGVHTLSVRDASNCIVTQTINIQQPNPLVPSITSASVTCFNACNGSLAGSVLGGTPGYTLFWTTPTGTVAGGNLINQCAGNYTFHVLDANSCTVSTTFTLNQPPDITATLTPVNPSCNGNCNGSISANILGGTPGYTLNWSSGAGNPNINRCAGTYTLIVVDTRNCQRTFTTTLTAPPALTLSVINASTSCAGSCDGSATVTAAGGVGSYTYQINTIPIVTNTTGVFVGLCAGPYIVNVTDANGCTLPQAFNISSPPLLTAAITGILPTCNVCTGASTVTVTGGTPGYTVNWTNTVAAVVATGTTASNLCLGNYTASVVDSRGCTANASVSILNTVSVTVITGGNNILCFGVCNASATANAIGGTAPYNYSWNSLPPQAAQTATGLCAGNYTVTVTDANLCSNTGTIAFTQPSSVTVNSTQTNIPCFAGCNGAITTTVSGGTPAYTYSWSPGGQTTPSLSALCTGTYVLEVRDFNICSQTFTFVIAQNPSITAVFTATSPSSCVLNNGTIQAVASGGSGAGYTFTWSPATTSAVVGATTTATGLGAGSYSLFIQDGAGCTASLSTNLSSPNGPTVNVVTSSVTCNAANNGSAVATALGTGPFTFTWSPATASVLAATSTTATGLGAGNYNINVTDGNGCITSQTLNITQPSASTITSNVTNVTCNGFNTGSITAVVSGGTPTYNINWLPAGTGTAITNQPAGNYTVNILDANGCASTRTFVITQPNSLTVAATQTNVSCNSFSTAAISLTVTGGTPAYTFSWSPVGTFTGSTSNPLTNIPVNVYTVSVSDLNNCTVVQTFTITQPAALGHTINVTNDPCNATCIGTASQVVTGGTPTYSFSWSSTAATTQSIGSLCAGNYTANVTDGNGCVSSTSFVITQPAAISITTTPSSPLCNNACTGSVTAVVSGGNPAYVLTWLPAGAGGTITNLCAGNYTLTVTDASLCTGNAVVTLTNPPAIVPNVSFTNALCNASCNGSAIATPLNGTAPYSYTWTNVPASNTSSATGLCAGTYTVFITDANSCTVAPQQITLNDPLPLNILASSLPATCLGPPDGSMTVSPSGGTPTYSYTWLPLALGTNSFVNNVGAGIYTVTVTDANLCTNSVSIIVNNSNGPSSAAVTSTNVNCFGQCTGAASIGVITGGNPGYVVSWVTPAPAATVNPVQNLCAGSWTAQIEDVLGCKLFTTVTITQPTAGINDNEVITDPLCAGVCSGSIVLNPTGGTPPYVNFSWSPSASITGTATNLCVGVHTATITDNLGCLFTATYNLNGQVTVTTAIASTSNICFGNCLATSSVTVGGGLAPYTYSWSNTQTGTVATSLCNGNYSVTVTDFNGCQTTGTTAIISPNALVVTPSISSPSCGLCNGSSTVVAAGGTSPFTYSWTSGSSTPTETNLCAGVYQVLVTDINGCSQLQNVMISNSSGITGETFAIQNELCFNDCNGSVSVTPIGGNPPITFSWLAPVSTNSFITNLCGGTYFVQMQDAQGCIRTSSVAVNSATNIVITPTVVSPTCPGPGNNGTIIVNVTGGTGTYTYNWSPAGNTATLNNVSAGIYTLTVTDGVCTKSITVNVNSSNPPMILSTKVDDGCIVGLCSGSVVITPTLGTPGYNVTWSNGNITNTVSGLCQGVITVTVTDLAGCSAVESYTINDSPPVNLSLPIVNDIRCYGSCDGSITIVPSGGVLPYVISWVPTTTVTPANPLTDLCAGNYSVTVTDTKGCSATSTFALIGPPAFTVDAIITGATCNTSNDGIVTTTVNGGTPAYSYSWNGPATFTTQNGSNLPVGNYSLSITDSRGCTKDTTFAIAATFTIDAIAGNDTSFCSPGTVILNGNNSTNAITYEWTSLPSTTIALTSTTSVIPPVGTNTYVLLVTSSVANCFDRDTIVVNSFGIPVIDAGPSKTIALYTSVELEGSVSASTGYTLSWLPISDLSDPTIINPIASNTLNTTFTVSVVDANGCSANDTVRVELYPEIVIPNGFSPNADGRNDLWVIDNIQQFTECVVEVYNRWGELLYSNRGYTKLFDGRYRNKDLPVGTYYYIINLNHPAYPNAFTGPLTIFR